MKKDFFQITGFAAVIQAAAQENIEITNSAFSFDGEDYTVVDFSHEEFDITNDNGDVIGTDNYHEMTVLLAVSDFMLLMVDLNWYTSGNGSYLGQDTSICGGLSALEAVHYKPIAEWFKNKDDLFFDGDEPEIEAFNAKVFFRDSVDTLRNIPQFVEESLQILLKGEK